MVGSWLVVVGVVNVVVVVVDGLVVECGKLVVGLVVVVVVVVGPPGWVWVVGGADRALGCMRSSLARFCRVGSGRCCVGS